ncbi:MAG: NAD-dependent epimerase/dehydratase family protein [Phycisphaerales bacterium]
MKTRREFITDASALTIGAAFLPSTLAPSALAGGIFKPKKLNILMLGGTGFAGPKMVQRALDHGHNVTLFNRGQTAPDMFPDIEHIQGDRYTDLSGLEKLVADGRKFDAVIDTFTYVPKTVTDTMDILLPIMGQYVVISTTSVYASRTNPGMDETGELATVSDEIAAGITNHREVGVHYGAMKARVEAAAEERFPGKVCVIRPGLIVGDRDTTGRFTYWSVRASEGGTMIGPGSGEDFIQVIDVRDLGDFTIHCIEQQHMGAYNGISPAGQWTSKDMVESATLVAKKHLDVKTKIEWIDEAFLSANGVNAWQHMPAWVPNSADGYQGQGQISTAKSIKAGLKTRPLEDTHWNALNYYKTRGPEILDQYGEEQHTQLLQRIRGGLDPAREQEVLKLWNEREDG